jgi:hypothetical protein
MITELGKRCQEMARIEDFASFKSELLGDLGSHRLHCLNIFAWFKLFWSYLKKSLVTVMSLQTNIWLSSNIAQPPPLSPYDYGWRKDAAGPLPLFSEGIMTSDYLQDRICSCKGKVMCGRSCVCNEQNMCCTELCPCQGSDFCMNPFWRSRENDRDSEGDEENDAGFSLSSCSWMK